MAILGKNVNPTNRKRKKTLKETINVMLYLMKTGCLWRMLTNDFPPYNTMYYNFHKWKNEDGIMGFPLAPNLIYFLQTARTN